MSGDITLPEGGPIVEVLDDLWDPNQKVIDPDIKAGLDRARTVEFWRECHARMARLLNSTTVDSLTKRTTSEPFIHFDSQEPRISTPEVSSIPPLTNAALLSDGAILITLVDGADADNSVSFQQIHLSSTGEIRYTRFDKDGFASSGVDSIPDHALASILDRILTKEIYREGI